MQGSASTLEINGIFNSLKSILLISFFISIAAFSINLQWKGALTFKSIVNLAPCSLAINLKASTDSLLPLTTICPSELSLAISHTPSFWKFFIILLISSIFKPIIADIFPLPVLSDLLISCPLYLTNFKTVSKFKASEAYKAVYSPRECPATNLQKSFKLIFFWDLTTSNIAILVTKIAGCALLVFTNKSSGPLNIKSDKDSFKILSASSKISFASL